MLTFTNNIQVFTTQESGELELLSTPLQFSLSQTTTIATISHPYTHFNLKSNIYIEIVTRSDGEDAFNYPISQKGMITLCRNEYAYTCKYYLASYTVQHEFCTYELIGMQSALEGEHRTDICKTRFDLGDGTYKEFYSHKKETGLIIERFYNRRNLWN